MDNISAQLSAYGTEDEDKQTKNTTQIVLESTMNKKTQIT